MIDCPLWAGLADVVSVVVVGGSFGTVTRVFGGLLVPWRAAVPLRAKTRPKTAAPLLTVTEFVARTFPRKVQNVPRVPESVSCQNTLFAWAPLTRLMLLAFAVVRVAARKMKTASGLLCASSVSVPVIWKFPPVGV